MRDAAEGPPPRHRRRWRTWIVVAAVLGVLGMTAYIRLGRIDARFIGRWVNARPNALPAECWFRSDGSSSWVIAYIGVPLTTRHGWFVRGNELVLTDVQRFTFRASFRSLQSNLMLLIDRLKDAGVVERFEILEISATTLKLKRSHPWGDSKDGIETYIRERNSDDSVTF